MISIQYDTWREGELTNINQRERIKRGISKTYNLFLPLERLTKVKRITYDNSHYVNLRSPKKGRYYKALLHLVDLGQSRQGKNKEINGL